MFMKYQNIAIFGAPRSGTTWLGQMLNSSSNTLYRYQPLFSYEFKDYLSPTSSSLEIGEFHTKVSDAKSDFVLTEHKFRKDEITHLVWKEVRYHHIVTNLIKNSDIKIIYIERNPVNVINSWYNAPKEFDKTKWDINEEWFNAPSKNLNKPEEFNGYNKWVKVRNIHSRNKKTYPGRVYSVKYEDLKKDTVSELKKVYNFCELRWDSQVEDFVNKTITIHNDDPYGVFKNKTREINLPCDIVDEIEKNEGLQV
jgi:hypothetical protein